MKKFLIVLAILSLSLSAVGPVMAQEAISVDVNAGLFKNENFGSVCDFTVAEANSGGNNIGEEAIVTTNSASAGTDTESLLNHSTLEGSMTDIHDGPFAYNLDTEEEDALAVAVDANLVGVLNFNMGMVGNMSFALANSGLNYGGEESVITTGLGTAKTMTKTDLNGNVTKITIEDTNGEGPVAFNKEGDDKGLAVAVDANAALVLNANMGIVSNFSGAGSNSGLNVSGEESEIVTGNAEANTGTTTGLNSNSTTIAITDTGKTGPVAANVDFDECSVAVGVDANAAVVFNGNFGVVSNVSLAGANTGLNHSGEESSIKTGNAVAGTVTGNTVNTNTTSVTIADNSNGPVAVNTDDDCEVNPCNPQIPNPCKDDPCGGCDGVGCEDGCGGAQGQTGPVAANIDTEGGVAVAVDANVVVVANNNLGSVSNMSVALANSGANGSGEESTVTTGNANASTGTTSTVNTNDTTVKVTDGASSGPVAANVETEEATAVAVDANVVVVSNDNAAKVSNTSAAVANTGGNGNANNAVANCTDSCDADEGSITTGNATANTTTTNNVNSNTTTFTINH